MTQIEAEQAVKAMEVHAGPPTEQEVAVVKTEVSSLQSAAKALVVTDQASYDAAVQFGTAIAAKIKEVAPKFEERTALAHQTWKSFKALESEVLDPLRGAKDIVREKCSAFQTAELQKRRAAEKAEADRLRKLEEDERMKKAEALQDAGMGELALEQLNRPVAIPAAEVRSAAAVVVPEVKSKGSSTRTVFKFSLVDPSKVKREFLIVDEAAIRALVKQFGERAIEMVGEGSIQVWEEADTRLSAAKS